MSQTKGCPRILQFSSEIQKLLQHSSTAKDIHNGALDPFGYPETEFKYHKMHREDYNLLAILKAECTAEAGPSLYHSCVQESRPVENGGIGILQPEVPRGWRGSYSVDNVRELQPQLQQNPLLNVLKIEEYFIGLYVLTFESILESIEGRYKISPIALSIEKYLAATNETELEECGESISTIAAHVGSNTLQLNRLLPKCNDRNKKLKRPFSLRKLTNFTRKLAILALFLKLKML